MPQPIAAGDLDRRIEIERDAPTRDGHGNDVPNWQPYAKCWAKFMPGTGRERREAAADRASLTAIFRVRKTAATRALDAATDRILFDNVVWDIAHKALYERDGLDVTATTAFEIIVRRLSGRVAASASVAGTVTIVAPLVGAVAGVSAVAGDLTVAVPLAGAVAGFSAVSGTLTVAASLAGAVAGNSAVAGSVTVSAPLAGAVLGASAVAGDVTVTAALAGVVAGRAATAGAITVTASLSGAVAGASAAAGTLTVAASLAGAVLGLAAVAGSVTVAVPLAGAVAAGAAVAGDVTVTVPLAGAVAASSAVSGTITVASTNLINNGTFDDASGWTLGGDAAISGGVASSASSGSVNRNVDSATLVSGSWYQLTGTIIGTASILGFLLGGKQGLVSLAGSSGAFTVYLQAGPSNNTLEVDFGGCSIDNLALSGPKTVTLGASIIANGAFNDASSWTLGGSNMTISGGTLNMAAEANSQRATNAPASAPVAGTYYQITLTISGRTSGSIGVAGPFAVTATMQSNATFTQFAYATATANPYIQTKASNTTLSVDNFALQAMTFS